MRHAQFLPLVALSAVVMARLPAQAASYDVHVIGEATIEGGGLSRSNRLEVRALVSWEADGAHAGMATIREVEVVPTERSDESFPESEGHDIGTAVDLSRPGGGPMVAVRLPRDAGSVTRFLRPALRLLLPPGPAATVDSLRATGERDGTVHQAVTVVRWAASDGSGRRTGTIRRESSNLAADGTSDEAVAEGIVSTSTDNLGVVTAHWDLHDRGTIDGARGRFSSTRRTLVTVTRVDMPR